VIIIITIDTREPRDKIWEVIADIDIVMPGFEFKKLDYGDYFINNKNSQILIERKEIHDFCSTFGELKERFEHMRERCERTALIIEGNYKIHHGQLFMSRGHKGDEGSISAKTFFDFKLSLQERGSYFDFTNNLSETIRLLCYWHDYIPIAGMNPTRKTKNAVEWFASMPGVGLLSAFGLKETYDNPKTAMNNIDEWTSKKAKKMIEKW
jgi:hypothetical protein